MTVIESINAEREREHRRKRGFDPGTEPMSPET